MVVRSVSRSAAIGFTYASAWNVATSAVATHRPTL
jgi:hypothetical protein